MTITEFLMARIEEDEKVARAASGETVTGERGNWSPVESGDEWEFSDADGDLEVLVALRPNLNRPPRVLSGCWGQVAGWEWPEAAEVGYIHASGRHIARHDPARVLAECSAKRAIIQSYGACQYAEAEAGKSDSRALEAFGVKLVSSGMVKGLELAVKHLASAYHTHPEYERDWADELIRGRKSE